MGRLSNPPCNFDRLAEKLQTILLRTQPILPERRQTVQPQRRLRPSEVEAMTERYRQGGTIDKLAVEFGVHRTTVMAALDRAGTPRRPHGPKLDDRSIRMACQLYQEGLSLAAIGIRFEVDPATIGTALKRAGVKLRPRRGVPGREQPPRQSG